MYFRDVIGQQPLKKRLIQTAISGQIPHALLLNGATGTGTLVLAVAFARYLACTAKTPDDACGSCQSCQQFNKLVHPDTYFVYPIFKPNGSKKWICDDFLPQWRKMFLSGGYFSYNQWMTAIKAENAQGMIYAEESDEILRKLSFKAYESEYKVMLIWLPEKMNDSCSNKLLKLLEEPPFKTVFLLVSENSEMLLSTIQSRVQRINVKGIETEAMKPVLQTTFSISDQAAYDCCKMAAGNYLNAVDQCQANEENTWFLEQFIRCMRGAYTIAHFSPDKKAEKQQSLKDLKRWAEEMARAGREPCKRYLSYAQHLVRENYLFNLRNSELNYLNQQERLFTEKFAPYINHTNIEAFMQELSLAETHLEGNVNSKLIFFDLALQTIMLFK